MTFLWLLALGAGPLYRYGQEGDTLGRASHRIQVFATLMENKSWAIRDKVEKMLPFRAVADLEGPFWKVRVGPLSGDGRVASMFIPLFYRMGFTDAFLKAPEEVPEAPPQAPIP